MKAFPLLANPPQEPGELAVTFAVPRGRSHVGPTVRLGAMEIPPGGEYFG